LNEFAFSSSATSLSYIIPTTINVVYNSMKAYMTRVRVTLTVSRVTRLNNTILNIIITIIIMIVK